MRKIVLTLALLFSLSMSTFADNEPVINRIDSVNVSINNIYNYQPFFRCNYRRVGVYLGTTLEQLKDMEFGMEQFNKDMLFASESDNEYSRNIIIHNAIKKHIHYMKYTLDEKQYKKYLMLFNVTLQNRGYDIAKLNNDLAVK